MIAAGRIETPDLTVIVLSGTDDRGIIEAAIDRGAAAYILKSTDTDAIATAIRQVFEPSVYLAGPKERAHAATTETPEVLGKLTRRELEILQLVSGGRSNRQVAQILWITDQTVKFHLANIYRKLGVRSRFEAARWARRTGSSTWSSTPARRSPPPSLQGTATATPPNLVSPGTRRRDPVLRSAASRKHRNDAERVLPSPGTAAMHLRGVLAGSDADGEADQVLHRGRGD